MSRTSRSGWSARAIAASLERSVHEGRMQPAESLPPVRELAAKLKVSPATVAAAYRLLKARGLTAADGRRGTRVIPRPPARARVVEPRVAGGSVDLASGNPDPLLLPPLEHALRRLDADPALYDRAPHLPRLLDFVAGELAADGVPVAPITLVNGALDGIERVLREHLRPGDHVAIEDPSFPAVHDLLVAGGLVAIPVAVDDRGMLPAALAGVLRRNCRACIVTARAQNPFGSALDEARADELRQVLRRAPDVLVIESDPCGPVSGVTRATLLEPSRHKWAHVISTAKFLGPDLRVAFVSGDAVTVNRVEGRFALGPRRVSRLLQQLVLALWSDPAAGRHLARAAEIYRQRRTALMNALAAHEIAAHAVSGLNVWIGVRYEGSVVQGLADRGWAVAAGEPFRLQSSAAIRVTAAALTPEAAPRFAADLAEVLSAPRHASA